MKKRAIILFSGGLDSTTCLAYAKNKGYDCYALSFHYGQKHHIELEFAKKIAQQYGVSDHKILSLPANAFANSSLTDETLSVPDYQGDATIPNTYVPARNTIFLSFALGFAEVVGAEAIFVGANAVDYSGYPDCRPVYLEAFEKMAQLATNNLAIKIHAPLLTLTKAEIIKLGHSLGVDYQQTVSCYRADKNGNACGRCDSCIYRKKGFADAGVTDPTRYY